MRTYRVLVSGVGSVGERHIRNLLALGYHDIAVHRSRALPFRTLDRDLTTFRDLEQALAEWRPEVVFVTGPTMTHLASATVAAQAGCHLFVEKPLTHSLHGIATLKAALRQTGKSLMVGYMLRFHPLLMQLKAWLDEGLIGQPLYWRSSWGEYLPDWHPWEDYRESYVARRDMGGGPALTLSHDLDLALWLFGEFAEAYALRMPESPLHLDFAPGLDFLLRHASGVASSVHLDLYQRPPQRVYELVGSRGRAAIDYQAGRLSLYSYPDNDHVSDFGDAESEPQQVLLPTGWDRNEMFLSELRYFFACLDQGVAPHPGLAEGAASAALAERLGDGGTWSATAGAAE